MPAHHKKKSSPLSPISLILLISFITLIFLFLLLFSRKKPPTATNYQLPTINPQLLTNLPVPEVGSHLDDPNSRTLLAGLQGESLQNYIAIPLAAIESTPGARTKIRQFNLQANKSAFQPNVIAAYLGDIVRVNLFAVDNKYDFTIPGLNIAQTIQMGETKSMEFQVTNTGTFEIACSLCSEAQKPRGYLVVQPLK